MTMLCQRNSKKGMSGSRRILIGYYQSRKRGTKELMRYSKVVSNKDKELLNKVLSKDILLCIRNNKRQAFGEVLKFSI